MQYLCWQDESCECGFGFSKELSFAQVEVSPETFKGWGVDGRLSFPFSSEPRLGLHFANVDDRWDNLDVRCLLMPGIFLGAQWDILETPPAEETQFLGD